MLPSTSSAVLLGEWVSNKTRVETLGGPDPSSSLTDSIAHPTIHLSCTCTSNVCALLWLLVVSDPSQSG